MTAAERVIVFWVPDWPVEALLRELAEHADAADEATSTHVPAPPTGRPSPDRTVTAPPGSPTAPDAAAASRSSAAIALIANRQVVACSDAARAEGVRAGLREREAQSRCPALAVHAHDPEVDERQFRPVLAALEQLIPGIELRRPGMCAMRARGPARYYGGEEPAAAALIELATELGFPDARIGIADGLFAAEQAARATSTDFGILPAGRGIRIVRTGESAAFLRPLPVARAAGSDFASVLHGLGIHTMGALAALPEDAVRQRFGATGVAAHRRAAATGPGHGTEVRPRTPIRDLAVELAFEPPIDTADQLAFACMRLAERFTNGITEDRLVCTAVRIELTDDIGVRYEREWLHPHHFTASDTVGRIRWQASSITHDPERGGAGIVQVRVTPTHTDRAAKHEPGLWSTEPDERVHHHLSRAQSRLRHTGVGTMELAGGRLLADRQRFSPWSTRRAATRGARASPTGPWPGAIPGPSPSRVFPTPIVAELTDATGRLLMIDADDLLTGRPARLRVAATEFTDPVTDWSLPWAVRERWWQDAPARFRLQLQLANGDAWLLYHETDRWFAEGRYD